MTETARRFAGFPLAGMEFYHRLSAENSKAFWEEHREVYETTVRAPMLALTESLAEEFGQFKLFRPNRDVRFSKDKSPYKTHQGAVTEGEGGEFYYLQISAEGLFLASGYYQMARDQLDRFRRAVVDEVSGPALVATVARLERRYDITGRELSTAPRGYPRDHPRVRLLQHKGLMAARTVGTPGWLSTPQARRRIADAWRGARPLHEWLNTHVGPSTLAPDEPY